MTGTPRMCERPIGILVDALKELGADIQYENQLGYPHYYCADLPMRELVPFPCAGT